MHHRPHALKSKGRDPHEPDKTNHVLVAVLALLAALRSHRPARRRCREPSEKPPEKPATEAAVALNTRPTAGDSVAQARFAWYLFIQAMTPSTGPGGDHCPSKAGRSSVSSARSGCTSAASLDATQKTRKFHGSPLCSRQHGRQHGRRRYPEQ